MSLIAEAPEIFSKIEPGLVVSAKKYQIRDAIGEARSWYPRFCEILTGFDNGKYVKEYKDECGILKILPIDPPQELNDLFKKSLYAYLKTAFKYELLAEKNKGAAFVTSGLFATAYDDRAGFLLNRNLFENKPEFCSEHDETEIITINDLLSIIGTDIKRTAATASIIREDTNHLFIKAVYNHYLDIKESFGDFPIVRDYFAENHREFFVFEIKDGRNAGIKKHILALLTSEKNNFVAMACRKLILKDSYHAINKRITRYFSDFKGMPFRLKEMKLKNSKLKKKK